MGGGGALMAVERWRVETCGDEGESDAILDRRGCSNAKKLFEMCRQGESASYTNQSCIRRDDSNRENLPQL